MVDFLNLEEKTGAFVSKSLFVIESAILGFWWNNYFGKNVSVAHWGGVAVKEWI